MVLKSSFQSPLSNLASPLRSPTLPNLQRWPQRWLLAIATANNCLRWRLRSRFGPTSAVASRSGGRGRMQIGGAAGDDHFAIFFRPVKQLVHKELGADFRQNERHAASPQVLF